MIKRKALVKMIQSSLIIALIPLLTITLLTYLMNQTFNKQEKMLYSSANDSISSLVKHTVSTAANISYSVSRSKDIRDYLLSNKADYWAERNISAVLTSAVSGAMHVEECYIEDYDQDRILSTQGNHDKEFFFKYVLGTSDKLLQEQLESGYSYIVVFSDEKLYVLSKIYNNYSVVEGYSAVVIDINSISNTIVQMLPISAKGYRILMNGNPILSNFTDAMGNKAKDDTEIRFDKIDSSIIGNTFTFYLVFGESAGRIDDYLRFVSICIAITMLLCVVISFVNYKPIYRISSIASARNQNNQHEITDEYKCIEESLLSYRSENEWLERRVYLQNEKFQRFYIEKLLLKQISNVDSVTDVMQSFGMHFEDKDLFAILIEIEFSDKQAEDLTVNIDYYKEKEIVEVLKEVIQDKLRTDDYIYCVQVNGNWVMICSVDSISNMKVLINDSIHKLSDGNKYTVEMHYGEVVDRPEEFALSLDSIYKVVNDNSDVSANKEDNKSNHYVDTCISVIHSRYMEDMLNVEALAEECGVSLSYLSKVFKKEVGVGLLEYLQRYRIMRAKQILEIEPRIKINVLCEQVGYANVATFIRVFKRIEGVSPGQYKNGDLIGADFDKEGKLT